MGGLDKLMERLKELFDEQKERHEGGNKWIGTGGTSPFGNGGYNPEGVRIGGDAAGNRTAVKAARATSRSRCAACAASPAKAPPKNSICPTRSAAPPRTPAGST
jgi:hypothetical protein